MTTIEVEVTGGISPIPIKVVIDNIHNAEDLSFKREYSFSESYPLPPGEYLITVSGMNPSGGRTKMKVSGYFQQDPEPAASATIGVDQRFYSKFFYVKI